MSASAPDTVRNARSRGWNAGSWFGSQVGGTCWMLLASIAVLDSSDTLAFALLALFIAVNGWGWVAWSRQRETWSVRAGYSALVIVVGLATLAGLFAIEKAGQWSTIQVGSSISPAITAAIVIVVVCITLIQIARRG